MEKLERVFRRLFPGRRKIVFFENGDKSDLKGRFRANSDKLISQERKDEKRGS